MPEKTTDSPEKILDMWELRRKLRRWRGTSLLFFLTLMLLLFGESIFSEHKGPPLYGEYIARVTVSGMITSDMGLVKHLESIAVNHNIKGVLLHINSPGGSPVGGEMIYRTLRKIAQNKPVVALMDDVAASAGYMIALGADRIIAHKTTITASIGAVMYSPNFKPLADKLGIELETYKSSPLKASPNPLEQTPPEAKQLIQESVWDTYQTFLFMVHERRNIQAEQLIKVADGRIMTGNQALQAGLIDAIGGEDEALEWLQNQHLPYIPPVYDLSYNNSAGGHSILQGTFKAINDLNLLYKLSLNRVWAIL